MSVEILPIGHKCNLNCSYCYQSTIKNSDIKPYDFEAIKQSLLTLDKQAFSLFGGEALLLPLDELERFFKLGYETAKRSSIQTNATLITDKYIELFKKYNVSIGASLDGPEELNSPRCNLALTRKANGNISKILEEKIPCSLIITLHKENATKEKLPRLLAWLKDFGEKGMKEIRIHLLAICTEASKKIALSDQEAINAILKLREELPWYGIRADIFDDIANGLRGKFDKLTCMWNGCDPWNTSAVQGIDSQGAIHNCGRVNQNGIDWLKASDQSRMRTMILAETPQEDGGCKDCRFFVLCKGACPGNGIDGDWRNRTIYCNVWKAIFEVTEKELMQQCITPISQRKNKEQIIFEPITYDMFGHADIPHGDKHGDHYDGCR